MKVQPIQVRVLTEKKNETAMAEKTDGTDTRADIKQSQEQI